MKIEDFNQYSFTGPSQYTLDETNYVVAVKENSKFSTKNILPLYYVTNEYEILGIDEEIGDRLLVLSTQKDTITEDISTRFNMHELFKIIRGPFQINDRHDYDYNVPKTKIYKNYLLPLNENEIVEIFEASIDVEKSRILIKDEALREMISKKNLDSNQVIMCLFEQKLVGPFHLTKSDTEEYFLAKKSEDFKFGVHLLKEEDVLEVTANGITRHIIYNPKVLHDSFINEFDFISTRELLFWFENEILKKNNTSLLSNTNLDLLVDQLDKINNSNETVESKERYERLFRILSYANETLISKQSLLSALPQFSMVKEELELLESRRLELRNSIANRSQELEDAERNLLELRNEKVEIGAKIEELRNQHQAEQNKIRDDIKNEIYILENQKRLINQEIEIERSTLSKSLYDLKEEIKYLEKRKSELDTAIETLKKYFTSEQKTAHEKLSELVKQNTHFNFISGRDLPSDKASKSTFKDYSFSTDTTIDYGSLRSQISEILKSQQRFFENHFIDNLLICLHQNTLTLFAGPPGTGKTSLSKIVTSALSPSERIREIPVSRGWTSQKDLIGFSNPLSKSFYESQTKLYSLLQQLNFGCVLKCMMTEFSQSAIPLFMDVLGLNSYIISIKELAVCTPFYAIIHLRTPPKF